MLSCRVLVTLIITLACAPSSSAPTAAYGLCDQLSSKQLKKNSDLVSKAALYAPYAVFANNAYDPARHPHLPLPSGWSEDQRWRHPLRTTPTGFIRDAGLAYAVFHRGDPRTPEETVIAFRGTDSKRDWVENLIPFLRRQLAQAEADFRRLVTEFKDRSRKITVVGHSLGGGLAFHMSFVENNVSAIGFNSAPVMTTRLGTLPTGNRVALWERGEILQPLRETERSVEIRWELTEVVAFHFYDLFRARQHGMGPLAANMLRLGAIGSDELRQLIETECQR